jgi:thiol-disulfide isomerase/thioredoxin
MADDSSALEEEDGALGTTIQTTVQQSTIISQSSSSSSSSNMSEVLSNTDDGFGKSIPYKPPQPSTKINHQQLSSSQNQQTIMNDETEILKTNHNRNIIVAISSLLAAILHYIYQYTHPITAVSILLSMQSTSSSLTTIGHNGKPTVIDFWAPWCTNCRYAAPTLQAIEVEYANRINFILVNADDPASYSLIQALGVDAIPHLALVDSTGYVETALIGPVSRKVLREDLDALLLASTTTNNVSLEKGGCGRGDDSSNIGEGDDTATTLKREKMITTTIATTTMMDTTPAAAATTNKLLCHADLPYKMYDAFENKPEESRHVNFVER